MEAGGRGAAAERQARLVRPAAPLSPEPACVNGLDAGPRRGGREGSARGREAGRGEVPASRSGSRGAVTWRRAGPNGGGGNGGGGC